MTLAAAIASRIARDGPITVAEFMALALGDERFGYYRRADPLGRAGDFITAPEISQVFGELIGLWAAVTWRQLGAPDPLALVELGPGRGTLMADALRAAATVPEFRAALRPHLVETSPLLRSAQRHRLGDGTAEWHDDFAAVPRGPLLLIANEFFDALPVRQLVRTAAGWRERCVGLDPAGGFAFTVGRAPRDASVEAPAPAFARAGFTPDVPIGGIVETCPSAHALTAAIARRIAADGGAALIVDYGPARSGPGDTLQSVRRHRRHAPLAEPGMADLTAHVDFAALAGAARAAGAAVHGPLTQGVFLRRLGIEARGARLIDAATPDQAMLIRSGCRRLIDPLEMGSLFKVLALTGRDAPVPAGFEEPGFEEMGGDRHHPGA